MLVAGFCGAQVEDAEALVALAKHEVESAQKIIKDLVWSIDK